MLLLQFSAIKIFKDALLCSGHVMTAPVVAVSELGQVCALLKILLRFPFSTSSFYLPFLEVEV